MDCPQCGAVNSAETRTCFKCNTPFETGIATMVMAVGSSGWSRVPTGPAGVEAASQLDLAPGVILGGRYEILQLLGKGGMGAVYKAEDTQLGNRLMAVKEMSQSGLSPQELIEATFERAIQLVGQLPSAAAM